MDKRNLSVAVYSARQRDLRVIGIVLTHLKSADYVFTTVDSAGAATVDVAILDAADPDMVARHAAALQRNPDLQTVHVLQTPGADDGRMVIAANHLMQLLPVLEKAARLAARAMAAAAARAPQRYASNVAHIHGGSNGSPAAARPGKLRALVVDDSQTVRTQLASVMSKIGMACDSVDGASAALTQLANCHYDLIYVDVMMPGMDGYTLTREIRKGRHHKTPVIILTSQSSPFDRARGALAGCDSYLTKPVGFQQFYAATSKALRKSLAIDDLSALIVDPTALAA